MVLFWAKQHILNGFSLGGHHFADQLIGGETGFLVEYREHLPSYFADKFFYSTSESGIDTYHPAEERRRLAQEWKSRA